jgi:hypothetical protein
MAPEIAADIVYGSLSEKEKQKKINEMVADTTPYPAARSYLYSRYYRSERYT